jgi:hypothetical protein
VVGETFYSRGHPLLRIRGEVWCCVISKCWTGIADREIALRSGHRSSVGCGQGGIPKVSWRFTTTKVENGGPDMTVRACGSLMIPESNEANGQGSMICVDSAVLMYNRTPTVALAPAARVSPSPPHHRARAHPQRISEIPAHPFLIPYPVRGPHSPSITSSIHLAIVPSLLKCFHDQSDSQVALSSIEENWVADSDRCREISIRGSKLLIRATPIGMLLTMRTSSR